LFNRETFIRQLLFSCSSILFGFIFNYRHWFRLRYVGFNLLSLFLVCRYFVPDALRY